MQRPLDTTEDAHAVQMRVYRRMGRNGRAALGLRLADEGRDLARAGIRRRHPDYDARQVEDALRLMYLGEELFRAAWPDRELVRP